MEKLKEFPKNGWCSDGSTLLYDYLKKRNPDNKTEGRKDGGFAWNEYSYWGIEVYSNKPKYCLDQLKPFIDKKEYKQSFKPGDLEKVVENTKEEVNNDETFVLHEPQQKEIQKGISKGCLYYLEGYSDIKTELLLSKRKMRKISRIICYVKPNSIFPVEVLKKQLKIINTKKRRKFLLRNSL